MPTLQSIESQMRTGRWREAQSACRELLFANPTHAQLHALEGICLFRLSDYAAAESCFKRATALDPSYIDAGVKRCQCLERLNMFEEAVYLAREWQAKRPADPALAVIIRNHGSRQASYRTEAWEKNLSRNRCMEYARTA